MSLLALILPLLASPAVPQDEGEFYTVEYFPPPPGAVLEVGGMGLLPDGSLAVSTRRGQVWILENPEVEDVSQARWRLFTEGLREGLGMNVIDGEIHLVQRGELSRLRDEDGDGTCDHVDTICNSWGMSGNYHEFAFGLPRDEQGNFFVTLNVSFFSPKWWHGKSPVPYRGWALRISPEGELTPWAHGFRSPCGVGQNAAGDIFITDNQGDWCASSPIYHLVEGGFYGHPASLEWTPEYRASGTRASDEVPPAAAGNRRPAAIWIPYDWSRSTGNLVHDSTAGAFGPFEDDLFVAELTNGMVLRGDMKRVRGEYQGWIQPFRQGIGSVARVLFSPEGTLFCGMTNRGWGGRPPADGLARVRWTGRTPLEIADVELLQDGFRVSFTKAVRSSVTVGPESASLYQYDYNYWWEYGSPPQHHTPIEVTACELSDDRRVMTVHTAGLTAAMVARVTLAGVEGEGGDKLLHPEFAYTINQLPEGPLTDEHVCKIVPPPPSKETGQEGWLMLSWGDPMDRFRSEGWSLVDAQIDRADRSRLALSPGNGALVNAGEQPGHYASKDEFGDCSVHLGFMLPEGGESGVLLMGRYEIQLADSPETTDLQVGDCGSIDRGRTWSGAAPRFNGYRHAGEWHELDIRFSAPRFAGGAKVASARFNAVLLDGKVVLENVDVPEVTRAALFDDESQLGPLVLLGDSGPVAFRDIRVQPTHSGIPNSLPAETLGEWSPVFPEEAFEEWIVTGDAEWDLEEDTITSGGKRGYLVSPRGDYGSFDLRARVRISDGGNSGLFFRAQLGSGEPAGYEAQVNSTFPDAEKTGSLAGLSPVLAQLIPAYTWFSYFISVREVEAGTHIRIWVNGVPVNDYVDTGRSYGPGHIALEQNHEGSQVSFESVQIRPAQ